MFQRMHWEPEMEDGPEGVKLAFPTVKHAALKAYYYDAG
jgi:hypothetical protein